MIDLNKPCNSLGSLYPPFRPVFVVDGQNEFRPKSDCLTPDPKSDFRVEKFAVAKDFRAFWESFTEVNRRLPWLNSDLRIFWTKKNQILNLNVWQQISMFKVSTIVIHFNKLVGSLFFLTNRYEEGHLRFLNPANHNAVSVSTAFKSTNEIFLQINYNISEFFIPCRKIGSLSPSKASYSLWLIFRPSFH